MISTTSSVITMLTLETANDVGKSGGGQCEMEFSRNPLANPRVRGRGVQINKRNGMHERRRRRE